ncbi:MAG: peptidylprolyl isomerase [Caulobacterales bacterium]
MASEAKGEQRRAVLVICGAAAGLIAALAIALGAGPPRRVPTDAAALVGATPITREDLARALSAMEADKRNPLTEADRALALRRLIEEEALVQRGIELGVAAEDPSVRKAIVQAMVQFATAQALADKPSEADLRAFYAERPALFAAEPQMRVHALAVAAADAQSIARVREALAANSPLKTVAAQIGEPLAPAPDRLLTPDDLRTYLGPSVAAAAFQLAPGQAAGPVIAGSAAVFLQALERVEAQPPPFEAARGAVEAEWRRRREDGALDRYLDKLRREADVRYAKDAPR